MQGSSYPLASPPLLLLSQLVLFFPTLGVVLLLALLPRSGRDDAAGSRQLLRWLVLPQLVVFEALAGRMHVLASWLVPAWWRLLPLAADWLAGLKRPWSCRRCSSSWRPRCAGGCSTTGCLPGLTPQRS